MGKNTGDSHPKNDCHLYFLNLVFNQLDRGCYYRLNLRAISKIHLIGCLLFDAWS